jgi:hypothetical protein
MTYEFGRCSMIERDIGKMHEFTMCTVGGDPAARRTWLPGTLAHFRTASRQNALSLLAAQHSSCSLKREDSAISWVPFRKPVKYITMKCGYCKVTPTPSRVDYTFQILCL